MKSRNVRNDILITIAVLSLASVAFGQPAAAPLTVQGLDQTTVAGVRSRGMGGTGIASLTDATALFLNPAGLGQLSATEIHAGGLFGSTDRSQT